jgi:hypothetical protein
VQEWMTKPIPVVNGTDIYFPPGNAAHCFVKFRASAIVGGLLVPEGSVPVQGTRLTAPSPGGGFTSNTFNVINATLPLDGPQSLPAYLEQSKSGIWGAGCYPLTRRPQVCFTGLSDSDYFPMFISGSMQNIRIAYQYKSESYVIREKRQITPATTSGSVVYMPCGVGNMSAAFPGINFRDIAWYFVELLDDSNIIIATTGKIYPVECSEDHIRIHFLNTLGAFDAVSFKTATVEGDIKSDSWQKAITDPFDQSAHGTSRFNVRSNRTYTVKTVDYPETAMDWMEELFRSPVAYMQRKGYYIPIVIQDAKFPSVKEDERYNYEVALQFKLSHEFINIRN